MTTKLIGIGNSRGVRIPKAFIEAAGLDSGPLRLRVTASGLLIEPAARPRDGWSAAAQEMRERGETGLLDDPAPTDFDTFEWEW